MSEREKLFKAYFLTDYLINTEFKGLYQTVAQEDLFYWCWDLINKKISERAFLLEIKFLFGLGRNALRRAKASYAKYKKEEVS